MTGLIDTDVAVYILDGRSLVPLPVGRYGISVITEMELLAWPSLTTQEEVKVKTFLQGVTLCELTMAIRQTAVRLRRQLRLKLPDAIIGATALEHQVQPWTNDERLHAIPGLICRSVPVHATGRP